MTTLYINRPTSEEEKFQTRLGTIESDKYIKISSEYDGQGSSKARIGFESLILLEFPCQVEDIRLEYQEAVSDDMLHIWILLKNDGAVIRQHNHFLIARDLFEKNTLQEDNSDDISLIIEQGVPYEDAVRLLKKADNVDEAIELWWMEQFAEDSSSSEDEEFINKSSLLISLTDMGFESTAAEAALVETNYDILLTIQQLSEPVDTDSEPDVPEQEAFYIERIVKVSERDKSTLEVMADDSITKCIYNVALGELAEWIVPAYDHKSHCAVFFISEVENSSKIKRIGSKFVIQRDILLASKQTAGLHGLFTSVEEAIRKKSLNEKILEHYDLAREACGKLYVEGQEYKCTWESPGPEYIIGNDEKSIRKALEFKLKDISARAVRARTMRVPENRIDEFVRHAIHYVTCILDSSLIQARKTMPKKLRRQRSEGYTPPLKMQRQKSV
jgi:hypothetical protein